MSIFQSIILGIVQGLTEFLPVSSSGHLVIVPFLLNWKIPEEEAFVFDVLVQVATLLAVFAYFRKDLVEIARAFINGLLARRPFIDPLARTGWLLVLATIPAGLLGLLFKDQVEQAFASPLFTGVALLVTAALLLLAEKIHHCETYPECLTWRQALWIGCFQALALLPGISRSGSTIAGGMTARLSRPASARFSFLMSIPIMLAAGLAAIVDLVAIPDVGRLLLTYIPGFISAAIVGYLAIRWLLAYLARRPLYIFSIYCTIVGLVIIGVNLVGK